MLLDNRKKLNMAKIKVFLVMWKATISKGGKVMWIALLPEKGEVKFSIYFEIVLIYAK